MYKKKEQKDLNAHLENVVLHLAKKKRSIIENYFSVEIHFHPGISSNFLILSSDNLFCLCDCF